MDANSYQQQAARTLVDRPDFEMTPEMHALVLRVLALAIATARVAEVVKKGVFHQQGLSRAALARSLTSVAAEALALTGALAAGDDLEPLVVPTPRIRDDNVMLEWNAIGLIGETGELVELISRIVRERTSGGAPEQELDEAHFIKEAGDIAWYLAGVCTKARVDLGDVMAHNIEKLKARYPNGWDHEDSAKKMDEVAP